MDIKNKIYKQWQILTALIVIGIIFVLPVQVAEVTVEENPNDINGKKFFQNSPLELIVEHVPPKATSIALWTGDTIRASYDSPFMIRTEGSADIHTTLARTLRNERELILPIQHDFSRPLHITLTAPTLSEKQAIVLRTQQNNMHIPAYTIFVHKPFIGAIIEKMYDQKAIADDIEYVWKEGSSILQGKNPYKRAAIDTKNETKYATYFPLSYIVSASIQKMGFISFTTWLTVVRPAILFSQLICAIVVLQYLAKKQHIALGVFAFFLILFHRFALYPARVTHIDFPAIMFLLIGMIVLYKKPRIGYLLIGISLAIKQMAIFIIPLILIWVWQTYASKKNLMVACAYISLVPIISLLPFFIHSPSGVIHSILFSANRTATGDFASPDIATMLSIDGLAARLPMFGMLALIYLAAWKKEIGIFGASLAIFSIFIGFNPVLFFQYLAWIIPFIPLAISEATLSGIRSQSSRQSHGM